MTSPQRRGEGGRRPGEGTRARSLRALALATLALATISCAKCGKQGSTTAPVERVLPRGAVAVVIVPSVEGFGQKLKLLENLKIAAFLAQLKEFPDAKSFADSLVAELGIDVRSKEALEKAGVDGARAMGAAFLVTGQAYLALPVKDAAKLHTALETISYRRLGAGANGEQRTGDVVVKTFSPQQNTPARLGYVLVSGYALVATDDGIGKLAALAAMTESDSLSADANLKAQLARVPAERDAFAYAPNGSPVLARAPVTSALVTLSLSPTAFVVAADAPWKGDAAQLAMLEKKAGDDLLGYLPRDAFLVTRFQGDPSQLGPFAKDLVGPYLARAFEQGGFDLKTEVLDQVQPGAAASLSLADRPPMDRGLPALDIRQTNPFTYAHLSGVARAKAKDAVMPTLEKVAALGPRFGAQMSKAEREGVPAVLTTYAQGEGVHFAVKGDRVFFASPVQRLDALIKSDGRAGAPLAGLGDDALTVAIDLSKLSQSVRALPESAWGIGGFAIKAPTVRWLDATDDLKAITISAGAKDKAVQARVQLSLGAKAP